MQISSSSIVFGILFFGTLFISNITPILISLRLFMKNTSSFGKSVAFLLMFILSFIPISSTIGLYNYCSNCGSGCCSGIMIFPLIGLGIIFTVVYIIIMGSFNEAKKLKDLLTKFELEKKDNKNGKTQ